MASIELLGVEKQFPNGVTALRKLDLVVADGEFLVLVGSSGCGKSTALRIVAGLEEPTAGDVRIGDRIVTHETPARRDVAMVFQNYALYPHMTVRENLVFPLEMRRVEKSECRARIEQVAASLGLEELLERRPGQLSGGQRQRVALGRAIVRRPVAFLMDEPLSNLDAALRVQTRAELRRLHRELGTTTVYVTHDQEEAMTLGHRLAVMNEGVVQQVGEPLEVYERPANVFVAGFIGLPSMNLVECEVRRERDELVASATGVRFPLAAAAHVDVPQTVVWGARPQALELTQPHDAFVKGVVDLVQPLGREALVDVHIEPSAGTLRVLVHAERAPREGDAVGVRLGNGRGHVFDSRTGKRVETEAERSEGIARDGQGGSTAS